MDPGANAPGVPPTEPQPETRQSQHQPSGDPTPPAEHLTPPPSVQPQQPPSRYESQKRRDWNTFLQYLKNHKPPLSLNRCSGAHVIEFLKYLDQFGKTKVHNDGCTYFGQPNPPAACACPLKQAWGSLDALIGRLRAAYEENGGKPESNPVAARAVRFYLREVKESQAKARGIPYEKKKRKRSQQTTAAAAAAEGGSSSSAAAETLTEVKAEAGASSSAAAEGEGSGAPPAGSDPISPPP